MNVLEVKELRKKYVERRGFFRQKKEVVQALDGVSFSVGKGEIFGLLGANGAGKTTVVNIIAGIVLKDGGSVSFLGKEMNHDMLEKVNVATAYSGLMGHLSVWQNLRFFAKLYGVKDVDKKIIELLKKFGVFELKDKKYYLLSSGERMRTVLCKGLINDPELLILDEATVGLDPDVAQMVRKEIKNLGTTILFTSHNMYEVEELCNRVAFLHKGKILKVGTPKELTKLIKEQIVVIDFYPSRMNAVKALKELKVEVVNVDGFKVVLKVENAEKKMHDILHPLFKQGFTIRDITIEKPNLEDVFIDVARKAR